HGTAGRDDPSDRVRPLRSHRPHRPSLHQGPARPRENQGDDGGDRRVEDEPESGTAEDDRELLDRPRVDVEAVGHVVARDPGRLRDDRRKGEKSVAEERRGERRPQTGYEDHEHGGDGDREQPDRAAQTPPLDDQVEKRASEERRQQPSEQVEVGVHPSVDPEKTRASDQDRERPDRRDEDDRPAIDGQPAQDPDRQIAEELEIQRPERAVPRVRVGHRGEGLADLIRVDVKEEVGPDVLQGRGPRREIPGEASVRHELGDGPEHERGDDQAHEERRHDPRDPVEKEGPGVGAEPRAGDQEAADHEEADDSPAAQVLAVEARAVRTPHDVVPVRDEHEEGEEETEQVEAVVPVRERRPRQEGGPAHLSRFRLLISSSDRW
ncbi:hypothetical protein ABE10_01890, partial [Bacillus toyonensis]|nr:hypothetical protein [Bacillus toyonensis]